MLRPLTKAPPVMPVGAATLSLRSDSMSRPCSTVQRSRMVSARTRKLAVDLRAASGSCHVMNNRDEIDALLTRIGIIMEDG